MKKPHVLAFFAALLATPAAFACPGGACHTCSSFGSYVSSISLGVLIGVASIGVEKLFKRTPKA